MDSFMKRVEIGASERLSGTGEYYFSRKNREIEALRAAGKDIISLGIGSPDMPPHVSVIECLAAEAARPDTHGYQSYKGIPQLREAFASWYGRWYGVELDPATEILPLLGSKEGLMHIFQAFVNPGDKVLIPDPGYPTYRSAAALSGGIPVPYALKAERGYMPDFGAIERAGLDGVKIMVINYPHMPTGTKPTRELFGQLVDFALKHNILLVHDNPYSFIRNDLQLSILSVDGGREAALELNSLSKGHSMAGWRMGMLAGRQEWIDTVLRFKSNMDSGMFYPLQVAAAKALSLGASWFGELNRIYYSREALGYELLDVLGCTYSKGQAGLFIWASLPGDYEGDCFSFSDEVLNRCDVFVTPGGIFGEEGMRFIRISLCVPEEKIRLAIEKIKTNMNNTAK